MHTLRRTLFCLFVVGEPCLCLGVMAEQPLLAPTPPMGWNSWNRFGCHVDESLIRSAADHMVASGMRDAGYQYIVIDDCWPVDRDAQGNIVPDPKLFPSGMKALADVIIQHHHQMLAGKRRNDGVHYFHGVLALQPGVGRQGVCGHQGIVLDRLIGVGQVDAIEAQTPNGRDHLVQRHAVQAPGHELAFVKAVPVHADQPHSMAVGVHDLASCRVQGRRDR